VPETNHADNAAHPPGPRLKRAPLAGWGRYPTYLSEVYRPEKRAELSEIVASDSHQLLARGAGRAYGDAALNAPGRLIDLTRLNRMLSFYPETGILRCETGVTFSDITATFLPRGFFPPVVPGTRFVTMGGAIAADVHGKNHHRDSSLSAHVLSFDLMLASGEIRRCSQEENSDLFWATLGGMGLTGIVLEVELQLRHVESAWIESEVVRAPNIDEAIKAFERIDRDYGYSVAWIDCVSRGSALGRSVIELGDFATYEQLNPRQRGTPLSVRPRFRAAVQSICQASHYARSPCVCSTRSTTGGIGARREGSSITSASFFRWIRFANGTASTGGADSCSTSACGHSRRAARVSSRCSRR
jgi:decaprenylphospho-beta-D-ribofuranose 2-oxidase